MDSREIKYVCDICKGTGIYKGCAEKEGLGVVCRICYGKGYHTLQLKPTDEVLRDDKSEMLYIVNNEKIRLKIREFNSLNIRDDIKYVVFYTGRIFSPEFLFKKGADEVNVIRYSKFIEGDLPLPLQKYTCPQQFSRNYYLSETFKNDCINGLIEKCKKYGKNDCWEKFYGDAKTNKEKQKVLKMMR